VRSWSRAARWCLPVLRRTGGTNLRRNLWLLAIIPLGVALAGDHAAVEAREYSPYADPGKPVLSFLLSDPQNVEDFRREFGLSGGEMEAVLAATREENRKLAGEYAQSERLVEANEELSTERVAGKIAASDYQEKVEAAVAATKTRVEELLPPEEEAGLDEWADAAFAEERQEAYDGASSDYRASYAATRKLVCRVFATQYRGYTRNEVALPHRALKFDGGYRVGLVRGDFITRVPVREVGPWNTRDNYWRTGKYRTMWKDLARCMPEARAAYFRNYNRGKDEFGREVLNPAGVDLTPAVARRLGLKLYQNAWIYVRFPWIAQ
jgi:hypothetical protein